MPSFLELSPGLVIWTLVNFSIFAFIIAKFGWKPMRDGLAARENAISDAIRSAENTNAEAQAILAESKEKIASAQAEMLQIVREGKEQADVLMRRANEEADQTRKRKIDEAGREIDRQRDAAIAHLRTEVASMVVDATSKMLGRDMKDEDHKRLAEEYVNELSKN